MTWVKICGTTSLEDARLALESGADALGFVFAESPRRVAPEAAQQIIAQLPAKVQKVGVFVKEPARYVREVVERIGLTSIQLHGGEDELATASDLAPWAAHRGLRVILAFSLFSGPHKEVISGFEVARDAALNRKPRPAFLLDAGTRERPGGTGRRFNWELAAPIFHSAQNALELIVAGGLNPENVGEAIHLLRPWGVDVVSGVESAPGKKDAEKVRAFMAAVRQADKERTSL